jgi:hypothetical protein
MPIRIPLLQNSQTLCHAFKFNSAVILKMSMYTRIIKL